MARTVSARASEIAILNGLTVNIHLLLASFFRPNGRRRRILADGPLFPSDRHALASHLAQRGLDPATDLIVVAPRTGDATVSTVDLEAAIGDHAPDLALVFLSGVNFATGRLLEIERLTAAGHAAGTTVGWDLAHAAGNVELELHDWDVDFAAWCTYKYLNGGPGSVGAIFFTSASAATGQCHGSAVGGALTRIGVSRWTDRSSPRRGPPAGRPPVHRYWPLRHWPPRWPSSTRSGCRPFALDPWP